MTILFRAKRVSILLFFGGLLGLGIWVWSGAQHAVSADEVAGLKTTNPDPLVRQGVVIVKFKADGAVTEGTYKAGSPVLDARANRYGLTHIEPTYRLARHFVGKKTHSLHRIYTLHYTADVAPHLVAADFAQDPAVEYAEPWYKQFLTDTPNDTQYGSQPQFAQVMAEAAWDVVKGEQGAVVIAVADGGTDWQHEDLQANIWTNPNEIADNGIDDDGNGFVDDIRGWNFANNTNDPTGMAHTPSSGNHGTHVAGIAAAVTNNGRGVTSLSWNAQLMPLNINDPVTDRVTLFGYQGIEYAFMNGAHIVNCSWGSPTPSRSGEEIVNLAYDNGVLVVGAAGNGDSNGFSQNNDLIPFYPASFQRAMSVGSTLPSSDNISTFSNYGVSVDVFAPGSGIQSTFPSNTYGISGGTSMAAPMASALAALLKVQNPAWDGAKLRHHMRVTADPIDNANNAFFAGQLGKGRINAQTAVTATGIPSVRLEAITLQDQSGDGVFEPGESGSVQLTLRNFLSATTNLGVTLESKSSRATITAGDSHTVGVLGEDQETQITFDVSISASANLGQVLRFWVDFTDGTYTDRDLIRLQVAAPFVDHNTGVLITSATATGNIGKMRLGGNELGAGFVYKEEDWLFEGGLMVGMGATQVSDCIRGTDGSTPDLDFTLADGQTLTLEFPGDQATEETDVILEDSDAAQPLGLAIRQESFADQGVGHTDFVIFKYTLTNTTAAALNGLFAGLFFDWDINSTSNDFSRFSASDQMGWIQNTASSPTKIVATKVLTNQGDVGFKAIHNPNEIYDGFTEAEKWNFLSGGVQSPTDIDGVDVSSLVSVGPLNLNAGASVEIAFAVIGASDEAALAAHAAAAQTFWDNVIVSNESPVDLPAAFHLAANYPNPFNPTTTIAFEVPEPADVALKIYNVLGQVVRTVVERPYQAGRYQVTWNGRDDAGQPVATGVYLYQLTAGSFRTTKRLVLVK